MKPSGILALALTATFCLAACDTELAGDLATLAGTRASDEDMIAAVLNDVYRGLQTRQVYKVVSHLSPAYQDPYGRDYQAVQAFLNDSFKQYRDIRITRARPRIVVQGSMARAVETFGATAEPADSTDLVPLNVQGQVTVYLEKVGRNWKIVQWREAT